jgi:hypothetical protein
MATFPASERRRARSREAVAAASRASISASNALSILLTKKLATPATWAGSPPLAVNRSSPETYASAMRSYASVANSRVVLTLMPSPMSCSTAEMPSVVAGTLIMRLSRPTSRQRRLASSSVPAVSAASSGDTSRLTYPSRLAVCSYTGRRVSAASWMSRTASLS